MGDLRKVTAIVDRALVTSEDEGVFDVTVDLTDDQFATTNQRNFYIMKISIKYVPEIGPVNPVTGEKLALTPTSESI